MGEMSFVGPRPERPTVYDDLDGKVENFRSRMQVMPGLANTKKAINNVNLKYTQNQYVSTRFMKKYYECTLKYSIKIHLI